MRKGWHYELIQDLGSGMSYRKKGLKKLLEMILERRVKRVVLTHKDRLLRFGAESSFCPRAYSGPNLMHLGFI